MYRGAPLSNTVKADLLIKKIGYQFPITPEGKLMKSIVSQAIRDSHSPYSLTRYRSRTYIEESLVHAEICGVDPEWIRKMAKKIGLTFDGKGEEAMSDQETEV